MKSDHEQRPTPETDANIERVRNARWFSGDVVSPEIARQLERERDEAREGIHELNQRLIERRESFQAQLIRIEDTWREKLINERAEKDAQIVALREALAIMLDSAHPRPVENPHMFKAWGKAKNILLTAPPPVLTVEDVKPLVALLRRARDELSFLPAPKPGQWNCAGLQHDIEDCLAAYFEKHPPKE